MGAVLGIAFTPLSEYSPPTTIALYIVFSSIAFGITFLLKEDLKKTNFARLNAQKLLQEDIESIDGSS